MTDTGTDDSAPVFFHAFYTDFTAMMHIFYIDMVKYPDGDYVHPTKEGYELFYFPIIEKAIENAIMQRSN